MNEQYNNGFCPQCGALLKNGVCPCCQYGADTVKSQPMTDEQKQNPYGDPYYYMNQDFSQNSYSNSNGTGTKNYSGPAALIAGLMVLLAAAVIIPVSLYAYHHQNGSRKESAFDNQHDGADNYQDFDDFLDNPDNQNNDDGNQYKEYADYVADSIDWNDKSWKTEPENCKPDELWDSKHRYYEDFKNCIHEDVGYKIVFQTEEQLDRGRNVCMRVSYYQLEGDIPNLEEINRKLRDTACSYMDYYNEKEDEFETLFDEYGEAFTVSAVSYITYHDDSTLSMVVNNRYTSVFMSGIELDCVNLDLETGMILDNTQIIDPTEDFVKTVIDHSTLQNGSSDFLDNTETKALQEMFEDEQQLIVFYTPCGLEVGLNYTYSFNYGWITTTLTDYEQYLKSY